MQDYDVALKTLITSSADAILRQLGIAGHVQKWLNVELPKVQNRRVDLLGELGPGRLLHLEFQSSNFSQMPLRMLEYGVGIWGVKGAFPQQVVLFVGNDALRMPNRFQSAGIDYRYELIDIRDLDGEVLLESSGVSDNILALLTGVRDKVTTIRRIMERIARLEPQEREDALRKLLLLCGMRGLVEIYRQEEKKMPTDFDIMEHEIFGPVIRKARAEGARDILRRLIEKRFGLLPSWADQRLTQCSQTEAEDLIMRCVDARSLDELFA
jgi:hypothetical protein